MDTKKNKRRLTSPPPDPIPTGDWTYLGNPGPHITPPHFPHSNFPPPDFDHHPWGAIVALVVSILAGLGVIATLGNAKKDESRVVGGIFFFIFIAGTIVAILLYQHGH